MSEFYLELPSTAALSAYADAGLSPMFCAMIGDPVGSPDLLDWFILDRVSTEPLGPNVMATSSGYGRWVRQSSTTANIVQSAFMASIGQ